MDAALQRGRADSASLRRDRRALVRHIGSSDGAALDIDVSLRATPQRAPDLPRIRFSVPAGRDHGVRRRSRRLRPRHRGGTCPAARKLPARVPTG